MLPNREEALWDCACECALRRMYHDCKHKFDSAACNSCNFYIKHYGDFSPTDARLYMMEAGKFAAMEKVDNHTYWIIAGIFAAVIAFIAYANVMEGRRVDKIQRELGIGQPQKVTVPKVTGPQITEHPRIQESLVYTANKLNAGTDVNADGLVNCIDAAILFYEHYPDKNRVCIEINIHPDGRMSHLFNCVYTDGAWKAVEPQAYWKGHKSYWMKDIWGDAYDNRYNVDATEKYRSYVK